MQELHGGEECSECGTFRYMFVQGRSGVEGRPLLYTPGNPRQKPFKKPNCETCGGSKWRKKEPYTLTNCFGRKVRIIGGWSPDLYNKGFAFKPQSTVADCVLQGYCSFYKNGSAWTQKATPWTTIHDDVTIQYPIESDLTDMAATISDLANLITPPLTYHGQTFRLNTETKVGWRFGDPTKEHPFDGMLKLGNKTLEVSEVKACLAARINELRSQ